MDQMSFTGQNPDPDWFCIQRIREGDKSAFNEIFDRHKTKIIDLALRFTRSREAAEDIAQDIFIKIYEGKAHIDSKAQFSTWLYRVTVNTSIDFIRRGKLTRISLDAEFKEGISLLEQVRDSKSLSPGQELSEKEIKVLVQKEIDDLPKKFKLPILLYQFENLSYREISKILKITEKAVERRLYRAKEILRENLGGLL